MPLATNEEIPLAVIQRNNQWRRYRGRLTSKGPQRQKTRKTNKIQEKVCEQCECGIAICNIVYALHSKCTGLARNGLCC